jgi:hypothetical protein
MIKIGLPNDVNLSCVIRKTLAKDILGIFKKMHRSIGGIQIFNLSLCEVSLTLQTDKLNI